MSNTANVQLITPRTYWVVGGDYESMTFERLVKGTEVVFGPFASCEDAKDIWQGLSEKTRGQATVRFTIACEPSGASP
jgi:hypothetical protein